MKKASMQRVHALWDELAEYEASQSDQALKHLLQSICQLTGAVNAEWNGAVRMGKDFDNDPLQGWRIGVKEELMPLSPDPEGESFAEIQRMWNEREIDPSFLLPIRGLGTFRTYSLRRGMPQAWFDSPFYKGFFGSIGIYDGVMVGFPLNEDAESHVAFYFTRAVADEELDLLTYAVRGIKWFHRRQMLSHGLLIASSPLTDTERGVLEGLLGGEPEKDIAEIMGQSYHTTHQHVKSIYKKFGVNNRAKLTAIWLGRGG